MRIIKTLITLAGLGLIAVAGVIWSGAYNIAADDPHWAVTHRVLEYARERSVESRSAAIAVPDLSDPELVRSGAGNYSAMCVSCHLSPGAADTELSLGLYPRPPKWDALGLVDPRESFWIIKHGIKASGMPAWGLSMEDRYVWGMVAFMQQFSSLTEADYRAQVAASGGHSHGGGETDVGDQQGGDDHHSQASERSSFEPPDDPMAEPVDDGHEDHAHEH